MKLWRKLLWPFVPFYYLGALFIKKMYDWGIYSSKSYDFPIITVGNLSVGGTGKSPFVIYLVDLLLPQKKIAALSRGYGRTTKGFSFVAENQTAQEVGDEPLQLKKKFPKITVAVDADRKNGIEKLQREVDPEVIILDDAFQHRKVSAGLQILLTPFYKLYTDDFLLPAGDLREPKSGANRADIIVVTKCPSTISGEAKKVIMQKLKPKAHQKLYFTSIKYAKKVFSKFETLALDQFLEQEFLLVTGIANPTPLVDFLKEKRAKFNHKNFTDHHHFTKREIETISKSPVILTTEKDFMRLEKEESLQKKLFYLPIKMEFLSEQKSFNDCILNFANTKKR